jgi:predicted lactoylglutathione lyase
MSNREYHRGRMIDHIQLVVGAWNRETVNKFYQAGLKAGGQDNGEPGERDSHPGYYGAFLLDPDGNNIEAVYHGSGRKSVDSVKILFD